MDAFYSFVQPFQPPNQWLVVSDNGGRGSARIDADEMVDLFYWNFGNYLWNPVGVQICCPFQPSVRCATLGFGV